MLISANNHKIQNWKTITIIIMEKDRSNKFCIHYKRSKKNVRSEL